MVIGDCPKHLDHFFKNRVDALIYTSAIVRYTKKKKYPDDFHFMKQKLILENDRQIKIFTRAVWTLAF